MRRRRRMMWRPLKLQPGCIRILKGMNRNGRHLTLTVDESLLAFALFPWVVPAFRAGPMGLLPEG
jgi:hypothetical protein